MLANNKYFICLIIYLLLAAGCIKEFSNLSDAKIGLSLVDMKGFMPFFQKGNPKIVPAAGPQNLPCTDLVKMDLKAEGFPIYVDQNRPQSGDGSSWDDAVNSIVIGLKKAFDLRSDLLRASGANKDRPIYVLVAGGNYSFSYEDQALRALTNNGLGESESIVRFVGIEGQVMSNIHVLGGYAARDKCLENNVNQALNPNAQRETVLDGEGRSNHVILISGQGTQSIEINGFTVRGGNARGSDAGDPALDFYKKTGGGLAIRGKVSDISINNVKFEANQALYNGGCAAVVDEARGIYFGNVEFSQCSAGENGGALYLAGNIRDISLDTLKANDCVALGQGHLPLIPTVLEPLVETVGGVIRRVTGNGGALYLASENWNGEQNGVQGPHTVRIYHNPVRDPLQDREVNFQNNRAQANGGAIALVGRGLKAISLESVYAKTNQAGTYGGAIAIFKTGAKTPLRGWQREPENFPTAQINLRHNRFEANSTTANHVDSGGGGLALFDGVERVVVENSLFLQNQVSTHGGGILLKGAVHLVTFDGVRLMRNRAISVGVPTNGVGIYLTSSSATEKPQRIKIVNSLIEAHHSTGDGAGIYAGQISGLWLKENTVIAHNQSASGGGGAYLWGCDHLFFSGATFNDNTAASTGGALFSYRNHFSEHSDVEYRNNVATNDGGAFYISESRDERLAYFSSMPMISIRCLENSAMRRGGCGYIELSPFTWIFGGRYERNGLINHAKGINQPTERGGALYYASDSLVGGSDYSALFSISAQAEFSNNQARFEGGALYTEDAYHLEIGNATFTQNRTTENAGARGHGGAIYCDFSNYNNAANHQYHSGGKLTFNGASQFIRNHAEGDGGAVFMSEAQTLGIEQDGTRFHGNISEQGNGGAISVQFNPVPNTSFAITGANTEFSDNRAQAVGAFGGAVNISLAPDLVQLAGTFRSNQANNGGGAIHIGGARPIQNLQFNFPRFDSNATEQMNGGALLVDATVPVVNPFSVTGYYVSNRALNGLGGALALMGPIPAHALFTISQALIESNQAQRDNAFHIAHMPATGLKILDSEIKHHQRTTPGCGGAFDFSGTNLNQVLIENSSIYNNSTVDGNGGALCFGTINGNVTIKNHPDMMQNVYRSALRRLLGRPANFDLSKVGRVVGNRAHGHGGAFYFNRINGKLSVSTQMWLANQTTSGSGGALYVEHMGDGVEINSSMFSYNKASVNGGAVALADMSNHSVKISNWDRFPLKKNDKIDERIHPVDYLKNPVKRINLATNVYNIADAYRQDDARAMAMLDALNGTDKKHQKRGMFLVEENTADGGGGAFYIDGANRIFFTNISFANNKAAHGGTIAAANVSNVLSVKNAMIYGGQASGNAGGISVSGSPAAGARRMLVIENSSFQACEAGRDPTLAAPGSAGVFLENMNTLIIRQSNFFANRVVNAQPGSSWAAAVSFMTRTADPLPAVNHAYVEYSDIESPLLNPLQQVPVQMAGPIVLEDNAVLGNANPATSTSTISIPNALKTLHYFGYSRDAFSGARNIPPPAGYAPRQVVYGH